MILFSTATNNLSIDFTMNTYETDLSRRADTLRLYFSQYLVFYVVERICVYRQLERHKLTKNYLKITFFDLLFFCFSAVSPCLVKLFAGVLERSLSCSLFRMSLNKRKKSCLTVSQ